jgi:Trypsin-like peptidase domain
MQRELELDQQRELAFGETIAVTFERNHSLESAAPTPAMAHGKGANCPPRMLVQRLIGGLSPLAKITVLSALILLLGGIITLGLAAYKEFSQNRRLNDKQNRHLAKLEGQMTRTNQQVAELTQSSQAINAGLSLPTKLWSAYSGGICLISGTYIFVDPVSGRPLRSPKRKDGTLPKSEDLTQLTPEGDGEIAEVGYEGTGFYVGDGYILTNRHIVVEPWKYDVWLQISMSIVNSKPRLIRPQAFFPGQSGSYQLKFKLASSQDDLAVCTLNLREVEKEIPILPLDQSMDALMVGQAITIMGYPSGTNRLLSLLPEKEARRLREHYGESSLTLIHQLAQRDLIRPLASQGHIMGLHSDQIVYDGATGEGESGAPIFGSSGRVTRTGLQ